LKEGKFFELGDFKGAMTLFKEQEKVCQVIGNKDRLNDPSATKRRFSRILNVDPSLT